MKKIYITFAISCLILQPIFHADTEADLFGGINQSDVEVIQPVVTDEDTVVDASKTKIPPLEGTVDEIAKDDEVPAEKIQISNSVVAKGLTPRDFINKSNIEEIGQILAALAALSTENEENENLSANIQNLKKTRENLKKHSLRDKKAWELTVKHMVFARTAGFNDGQSETTDVNLVKEFLTQLYKIDSNYEITSTIQKRTNSYALQAMQQCKKDTLQSEIVPSYKSMIDSKNIDSFEHWNKVAIDRWGNDMYSCYRGAFGPAATVQVYLQVIKPELKLIKEIFSLIDTLDSELFYSLSRIEVPAETEESFKSETDLSLSAIIEAYNAEKRGLDAFLFEHFQDQIKDSEGLTESIETLKSSLLALKSNPSVSTLLTGQTDLRNTKINFIQEVLPALSLDLDDKLKGIGEEVELAPESVFEKRNGEYFLKKDFSTKIKEAKTSEELDQLLDQVKSEKHQIIAGALKSRYENAKANGASREDLRRYLNEMNEFSGQEYQEQFANSTQSPESLPTKLDSPIQGKIFNIQTSLRLLNAETNQIGSMYNNDRITIVGIRWGKDKTPIAYEINVIKKRLKSAFKDEETGFVSADYVKLNNQQDLEDIIATSSGSSEVTDVDGDDTNVTSDIPAVDPNLNYTRFEATPGKIVNISTSLRVLDRDSKQIGSMYSNEKVMVIGIHWKENGSEPLAYLIDLSSDKYKKRLKDGAKEEGFISADYCEFEDAAKLPNHQNLRDTDNKQRVEKKAQALETQEQEKQLAQRKSNLSAYITTVDEAVTNIKDFLDIKDNITRNKVNPNEELIKLLRELHAFVSSEPEQEDTEAKDSLSEAILAFFNNNEVEGGPKVLNYYFMSAIMKEFQTSIENLQTASNAYLETIK